MAHDANASAVNSEHVSDADAVLNYHTDNFDPDRPPQINEQYSRLATDLELSLDLHDCRGDTFRLVAESPDMFAPGLAAHDGNESSVDSMSTAKGAIGLRRPHLLPILDSDILGAQSGLTKDAVALHEFCNTAAYPGNTNHWFPSRTAMPYDSYSVPAPGLDESMFIAPRSNASSTSGLSSSSWIYIQSNEAEASDTTAAFICDTGRQFDDVSTCPLDIDEFFEISLNVTSNI